MLLETERMILRDYQKEDIEQYYKLKSDSKTMYYLQDIQLFSEEEARYDFVNVLADMQKDNRQFYFLHMELKETQEQVGSVGYTVTDVTPIGKMVHMGYFTYPQFWNQGYVTEAVQKMVAFAFEQNQVYRITMGCLTENRGSEKVMIKCGFVKEAEHKDYEWHDGRMKTRVKYRLLREDYEQMKKGDREEK